MMARTLGLKHWRFGLAVLVLAECATFGVPAFAPVTPAAAQFFDQRYPSLSRQRPRSGGFFENLFGGGRSGGDREVTNPRLQQREAPAESSRAPAARKETKTADQPEPTTNIVVLGDGMADWLAYGLEDAFSDTPEVGVVRRNKLYSGLLRYDAKNDLDWWHVARDLLASEKASYVVMMIGVADRQNLREKDIAKDAEQQAKSDAAKAGQPNSDQAKTNQANDPKNPDAEASIVAPEPKRPAKRTNGVIEFRTDEWAKIYSHRIDETIAALRSKGVPVFWVGLPSIRGTKSTADVSYLNDLYRARAEKAGVVYVDVWDGFVDEEGKYTTFGPDYEGQMRRLRSGDGVYFTKYGARKIAHYVEREIRRYMANRGPIALPMGPAAPMPSDGKPAARPLAGPVVPLTTITSNTDQLAGGNAAVARADASATAVLVKGDAIAPAPGRADDFIWPPGSERPKVEAPTAKPAAAPDNPAAAKPQSAIDPPAAPVATPAAPAPAPVAVKPEAATPSIIVPEPAPEAKPAEAKLEPTPEAKPEALPEPKPHAAQVRQPPHHPQVVDPRAPRPPQGIAHQPPPRRGDDGLFGRNGPFGFLR